MRALSNLTALLLVVAVTFIASTASAQSGFAAANYAGQQAAYAQQQQAAYQQEQAYAAYQQQMAAYQQQQQAYAAYQQQMAAYQAQQQQVQQQVPVAPPVARAEEGPLVRFDGRYAAFATSLPIQVQYAVNAANYLQGRPYVRGAGHKYLEDSAYDCSSSCSYALIKAGLLTSTLTSAQFANYGEAGPGRFITLWVKPGEHVFMTVCGLRLDTSGGQQGEGPRWRTQGRSIAGFVARHPAGL